MMRLYTPNTNLVRISGQVHSLINPFNPSWPLMDVQVSKMVSGLQDYRVICKAKIELHISPNTCMLVCGL